MDTDIDNYSHKDILALLKLQDRPDYTVDDVINKVEKALIKIDEASLENADDLRQFFKNCFSRVCVVRGFEITVQHRDKLGLPPLPEPRDDRTNLQRDHENQLIQRTAYEGSLRPQVPDNVAAAVHANMYVRGNVNPVHRETITTMLFINSKFREEYMPQGASTQGDRMRQKTLCTKSIPIYNILEKTRICDNSIEPITTKMPGCYEVPSYGRKGVTSDFITELTEPFSNVVSIKLAGLELMSQYYPVSEYLGTNVFTITAFEYDPAVIPPAPANVTQHQITISEGSYTVSTMLTYLNTLFAGSTMPPAIQKTKANYSVLTGKLRFEVEANTAADPIFPLQYGIDIDFRHPEDPGRPLFYNLGWLLGFRRHYYTFFDDHQMNHTTSLGRGINSNSAVNLIGTSYFLIEVDDFNNNNPAVVSYNCDSKWSYNIKNILGKVPNIAATNELLFEDSSDRLFKSRKYFGPVRIQKLRIRILDENGRQVDFGENDFTINLEVETLNSPYKKMVS